MANKYTKTPNPPEHVLRTLYFCEFMTQTEIGSAFDVSQKVVHRWFKELGIQSRTPKNLNQSAENNPCWKGDKAGYAALHYRVQKERGTPSKCEHCGTKEAKRFDWANVNGRYEDVDDYIRLCASCHAKFDNKVRFLQ